MKHKYKKFLLLATLLILALCMGALGVYHGVILPNSSELQTKRALKQLERVVAGSSRESFEKTLALMDDETLLCAIAEASLEAEEQGSSTQLAFFAPAAVERIGPKVTPAQLELLLRDDQYPAGFRSFMLEVTLYANGEEANGMILPSAAYTNMLKELIAEDGIEDDVLLEYALIAVPWEEDSEILQKIYEQRTDNPVLRRRAMELMAQYDPERAQEQLFSLVNNNSWIGLDMQTLKGYYAGLVTINTPQARQEALNMSSTVSSASSGRSIPSSTGLSPLISSPFAATDWSNTATNTMAFICSALQLIGIFQIPITILPTLVCSLTHQKPKGTFSHQADSLRLLP